MFIATMAYSGSKPKGLLLFHKPQRYPAKIIRGRKSFYMSRDSSKDNYVFPLIKPNIQQDQHLVSTPLRLTHRYFTPLYGFTFSPNPRLRLGSMFKLSTLIPDGSHPRTTKETETEFGMSVALSWVLVLRGAGRNIDCEEGGGLGLD